MDNTVFPDGQDFGANSSTDLTPPAYQDSSVAPAEPTSTLIPTSVTPVSVPEVKVRNKCHYVVLGVLAFLVLVLGVALIVIFSIKRSNDDVLDMAEIDNSADAVANDSVKTSTDFENLTKDEAVVFLRSRADNVGATVPENYVGKEITDAIIMADQNLVVSDLRLIYSYGDLEELEQMARRKYNPFSFGSEDDSGSDFEIKEYDYYAVVTPAGIKGATSCDHGYNNNCDSLLSFKRSYLDYLSEETSPHSFNDAFYVNTREPEVVNELLRVYTFLEGGNNIYSYSFEEQDERFVFTVNYVGVGINAEMLKNPEKYTDEPEFYAINLYSRRYAVDKADGHIYVVPVKTEPEVEYSDYIKSFPITKEEMSSLVGYEI